MLSSTCSESVRESTTLEVNASAILLSIFVSEKKQHGMKVGQQARKSGNSILAQAEDNIAFALKTSGEILESDTDEQGQIRR